MKKALPIILLLVLFLVSCAPKETVVDSGACPILAILPIVIALLIRRG